MKTLFNQDYYENGIEKGISCYRSYRWLPELTIPMCFEMIYYLNIDECQTVLDFGCSKGFVVKAMRLLHRRAYGVDISEYAIEAADTEVKQFLKLIVPGEILPIFENAKYDWIIAKDVLEHIPYESLESTLKNIREACKKAFIVVPLGNKGKYVIPEYELDITHQIREDLYWWIDLFQKAKFSIEFADYKLGHIKENWAKWERGNGFFILK